MRHRPADNIRHAPDDVLLEIFDFYVDEEEDFESDFEATQVWITLVHVCRRWRSVVFQSPRHLNLQLLCTAKTPATDTLDIWPPLPLIVRDLDHIYDELSSVDNIIAALERNDRVCQIKLTYLTGSELGYVTKSAAMQKPFPELTDLCFNEWVDTFPGPILPDSFLGGTAPRLRSLHLDNVSFPGLPKLLLSATHLVSLEVSGIPYSAYIPPEAMATSLSALTSLESLAFGLNTTLP
ncbi:hypothetical protein F5888DRAFT_1114701 [Russula emetica]|nr:hypothetical protein F5888DRAFT_1114701 [Russula emetica]